MSHTPKLWFNEAGVIKQGNPTGTDLGQPEVDLDDPANAILIVACVNGCAGLNPAAYRACVEALKQANALLIGYGCSEAVRVLITSALARAEETKGEIP